MIDSHAHIYLEEFQEDLHEVIERAKSAGVEKILMPNIDKDSIEQMLKVEREFPDMCFSMMGLHPCYLCSGRIHSFILGGVILPPIMHSASSTVKSPASTFLRSCVISPSDTQRPHVVNVGHSKGLLGSATALVACGN